MTRRAGMGLAAALMIAALSGCQPKPEAGDEAAVRGGQTLAAATTKPGRPAEPPPVKPDKPEQPAPPAAETKPLEVKPLATVEEYQKAVAQHKGKVVLVNFWATWCGPCVEEFPDLVKLRDAYAKQGLVFVCISLDFDTDVETKVKPFLTEQKVTDNAYLVAAEDSNAFINGIREEWDGTIPATFVYDKDGKLAQFLPSEHSYEEFEAAVKPLLPPAE